MRYFQMWLNGESESLSLRRGPSKLGAHNDLQSNAEKDYGCRFGSHRQRRRSLNLQLTPLSTTSEINEQEGYKFLFGGCIWAIRNPRGHEVSVKDDPDTCLDHLSFVSMLLRRLEQAGYK